MKLFYQQTNGLLIESEYFKDDLDAPAHFMLHACDNLFFTNQKLNGLPDKRFIRFAENEDEAIYLLDMENLSPSGVPLILLNIPTQNFCVPLTNSFDILLESACIGLLGIIEQIIVNEEPNIPSLPSKILKKKSGILPCLKDFFVVAKREYELLDIWHISVKAKKMVQESLENWFQIIKTLLAKFD